MITRAGKTISRRSSALPSRTKLSKTLRIEPRLPLSPQIVSSPISRDILCSSLNHLSVNQQPASDLRLTSDDDNTRLARDIFAEIIAENINSLSPNLSQDSNCEFRSDENSPQTDESNSQLSQNAPKRGPGRPRRNPDLLPPLPGLRRPVGRPPKNSLITRPDLAVFSPSDYEEVHHTLIGPPINTRNFLFDEDQINESTLIIDIPSDKFASLIGLSSSISFIPDNLRNLVRKVYIKYLSKSLSASNTDLDFKKLMLLPIILFANGSSNHETKTEMKKRIVFLLNDNWSTFSFGSFKLRKLRSSDPVSNEDIIRQVERYVNVGEIGKGYNALMKNRRNLDVTDGEVYNKLAELYPPASNKMPISDEQLQETMAARLEEPVTFTANDFHNMVMSAGKLITPAYDLFRFEHIACLSGHSGNQKVPDVAELNRLYALHLARIANGEVPDSLLPFFRDSESFAAPKKDTDIRPLGLLVLDRKLACMMVKNANKNDIKSVFENTQYAFDKKGCEKVIHMIRLHNELFPGQDIFAADGRNAFNNSNRASGLYQAYKLLPTMLPLLRMLYGSQSNTWFFGLDDGIKAIPVYVGSQQGCNLASLKTALSYYPMIQALSDILGPDDLVKFFADDGNFCASFDIMVQVVKYLLEHGPTYGYILHLSKGTYMLGRCNSFAVAETRRHELTELGLSSDIIVIHPADYQEYDNPTQYTDDEILAHRQAYGVEILGSFIGTDEFIRNSLDNMIQMWRTEANILCELPDKQTRYLLLRYCFSQKANYWFRTLPSRYTETFALEYEALKMQVLGSIFHHIEILPDWLKQQACFSVNNGGLGLQDSLLLRHSAFVASLTDCWSDVVGNNKAYNLQHENGTLMISASHSLAYLRLNGVTQSVNWGEHIHNHVLNPPSESLQHHLSKQVENKQVDDFKNSFVDVKHVAWFTELIHGRSGLWLNCAPKTDSTKFTSMQFLTALCYRLRLSPPLFQPGSFCNCKLKPAIEEFCHHFPKCHKDNGAQNVHSEIGYIFKQMLDKNGIFNVREPTKMFNNVVELADNNRRPDFFAVMDNSRIVYDHSMTSRIEDPIGSNTLTRDKALIPGRAIADTLYKKNRLYSDIAETNGLKFIALPFGSTGRFCENWEKSIKSVVKYGAAGSATPESISVNFWFTRLSCAIAKGVAVTIINKLLGIHGKKIVETSYELRDHAIIDSNYLRS